MKTFSLLEAPSEEFIGLAIKKIGGDPSTYTHDTHPQEDFLLKSEKYPIFVVADGVTLIQHIINNTPYPNPSPAGEVARIFCEGFIKITEEKYKSFTETDIRECFSQANELVRQYNEAHGRTQETTDYWNNDLFAATAAFVVIKDDKVYWGSICDSSVMHIQNGEVIFSSPACQSLKEVETPAYSGDINNRKDRSMFAWKVKRNRLNENSKRIGYGVVTGESEATYYLCSGSFAVKHGDVVMVITDGFEDFMKLPEFISLFNDENKDLESQVKAFTHMKAQENPEVYGPERSLISIMF